MTTKYILVWADPYGFLGYAMLADDAALRAEIEEQMLEDEDSNNRYAILTLETACSITVGDFL
jgi:hypothetical protein